MTASGRPVTAEALERARQILAAAPGSAKNGSACCGPAEQEVCCEPTDKAACCGEGAGSSCGCQ